MPGWWTNTTPANRADVLAELREVQANTHLAEPTLDKLVVDAHPRVNVKVGPNPGNDCRLVRQEHDWPTLLLAADFVRQNRPAEACQRCGATREVVAL